ncbi:MAG TPA: hypothetical protein VGB54_03795 [Allosphingosinicella sp.]|jgi:hypothetical protein
MLGRILLGLGALVLIGTAAFHASGGPAVAGWLGGERGTVVQLLWYIPTLDWAAVGVAWLFIAWRGSARERGLVWLLALIPGGAALMAGMSIGPAFVGLWLLAAATLLALLGSIALPRHPA